MEDSTDPAVFEVTVEELESGSPRDVLGGPDTPITIDEDGSVTVTPKVNDQLTNAM